RAGATLGILPTDVTVERLCALVTPSAAHAVRDRSAELRGLLAEIAREHGINRALMRQELAFLSHLTRLIGQDTEPGYRPSGQATNLADWTARAGALGNAETALAEPSDNGIAKQLQKFWDAWSDLANAPAGGSGIASRQALISQGQTLADAVRTVYSQIQTV